MKAILTVERFVVVFCMHGCLEKSHRLLRLNVCITYCHSECDLFVLTCERHEMVKELLLCQMRLLIRQLREVIDQILIHHTTERTIALLWLSFRAAFWVKYGRNVSLKTSFVRHLFLVEGAFLWFGSMGDHILL